MNRIRLSVAVLALLVVTAGCLGGSGPAVPDGSDGPDTDAGDTGAGSDVTLVENRTAALQSAGSYTSTWSTTVSEDGTVSSRSEYVTRVDYDARRFGFGSTVTSGGDAQTSMTLFHADGTTYQRTGQGEDAYYTARNATFELPRTAGSSLAINDGDDLESFAVAGTETFDGVQVMRYVREDRPAWIQAQSQTEDQVTWKEFTYEVLVDSDGLVRSVHWRAEGVDEAGGSHTVEFSYELTDIGSTSVEEPDWTSEAR